MSENVRNARQLPKRYFGLHFYPGVAEYGKTETGTPGRILVTEDAIRNMEPSFSNCPVFVKHIDGPPDLSTIEYEADGWVIRSFFNQADGKHWAEFLITTDKGHEAIAKGWRLSNAYRGQFVPKNGVWNSVTYQRELVGGEFEHLALVEKPRYNESVILTPEEFTSYNERCFAELKRVANDEPITSSPSKGALEMFKGFFKKTPVDADKDALISLADGREVTLEQLLAIANSAPLKNEEPEGQPTPILGGAANDEKDKAEAGEAKKDEPNKEEKAAQGHGEEQGTGGVQLANLDHHVMVNGAAMKISDMAAEHSKMRDCMNSLAEHYSKMPKKEDALDGGEKAEEKDVKAVTEKNSAESTDDNDDFFSGIFGEKPGDKSTHFETLANAHLDGPAKPIAAPQHVGSGTQVGKVRYGSK